MVFSEHIRLQQVSFYILAMFGENLGPPGVLKQRKSSGFYSCRQFDRLALFRSRLRIMYQSPANQVQARLHRAATRFGFRPNAQAGSSVAVCACCGLNVNSAQLGLCASTTPTMEEGVLLESFYLESGVCTFFTFVKFVTLYMLVLFLAVGVFALSMSLVNDEYCAGGVCGGSGFGRYSPVKQAIPKYRAYLHITDYLNLAMVGMAVLGFQFWRKYQRKLHETLKMYHRSQQDFSLVVGGMERVMGTGFGYESQIKQFLEEKVMDALRTTGESLNRSSVSEDFGQRVYRRTGGANGKTDIVKSVSLCYNLSDLARISAYRDELVERVTSESMEGSATRSMHNNSCRDKLQMINSQYTEACRSFSAERDLNWAMTKFMGVAFVSFQLEEYRDCLLQRFGKSPEEFKMEGLQVKLAAAPMPEDVQWWNLGVQHGQRVRYEVLSYLVLFFVVVLSFLLLSGLENREFPVKGRQASPFNRSTTVHRITFWYNILIAAITLATNYVIEKIVIYLGARERHETKTRRIMSEIFRILLSQVVNTVGIYFVLSILQGQLYLRDDGLVVKVCYFVVFMGGLALLFKLLRLEWLVSKLWTRRLQAESSVQVVLNRACALPEFDFARRYCFYITLVYMAVFFSYIAPICVAVVMVIFLFSYWIDKYHLFKCYSLPSALGVELADSVLRWVEFSLILFALGNLYFSWRIEGEMRMINVIALGVAVCYFLMVLVRYSFFQQWGCGSERQLQRDSYSQCLERGRLGQTYWQGNPATMCTEEPDLNRKGQLVDYHVKFKIAEEEDLRQDDALL